MVSSSNVVTIAGPGNSWYAWYIWYHSANKCGFSISFPGFYCYCIKVNCKNHLFLGIHQNIFWTCCYIAGWSLEIWVGSVLPNSRKVITRVRQIPLHSSYWFFSSSMNFINPLLSMYLILQTMGSHLFSHCPFYSSWPVNSSLLLYTVYRWTFAIIMTSLLHNYW